MYEGGDQVVFNVKSRLLQRKSVIKWTLEDFSKYDQSKYVNSPPFYIIPNKVVLELSLFRLSQSINLYLKKLKYCSDAPLKFTVTVTDGAYKIWYTSSGILTPKVSSYEIIYNGTCFKGENNTTGENVEIILALEMAEIETEELYQLPTQEAFTQDVQSSLSRDIASLLDNQVATDVTLRVDEDSVGAHKAILSARSPVFAKMFQHDSAESHTGEVNIKDADVSTVKELLSFMYSKARRDYDFETALSVYCAADKYGVVELRDICAAVLVSYLDKDNAFLILKLANRHDDRELKNRTMTFIKLNFESCMESDCWKKITNE